MNLPILTKFTKLISEITSEKAKFCILELLYS